MNISEFTVADTFTSILIVILSFVKQSRYKHRNQDEANHFIDNVIKKLEIDYGKILDLACGKGRHAYYLAQKGFDTIGVDLSPESIQYANTMYKLDNLEFYVHDMRLPFRIN